MKGSRVPLGLPHCCKAFCLHHTEAEVIPNISRNSLLPQSTPERLSFRQASAGDVQFSVALQCWIAVPVGVGHHNPTTPEPSDNKRQELLDSAAPC